MPSSKVHADTDISRCVLASGNPGKLRELTRIVSDLGITLLPQAQFGIDGAAETGTTFAENALIKAQYAASCSGLPAIADDSGLAVDALGGRPGVYSARFAGPAASDDDNVDKLLREMQDVPDAERGAAFRCAIVLVSADGSFAPLLAEAEWRGSILRERRGTGGFGYDPVLLDPQSGDSAAMLSPQQKNERSHRGKAMRKLHALLSER
jgi:XTP/dITP diphosphohydrolase